MSSLSELNKKSLEILTDKIVNRIDRSNLIFDKSISLPDSLYQKICDSQYSPIVDLWPSQIELLDVLTHEQFVLVAKHRRAGETLATCMYLAHELVTRPTINVLVINNSSHQGFDIIGHINLYLRSLFETPSFIDLYSHSNRNEIKLNNGSRIKSVCPEITSIIGCRYDIIYINEAAFMYDLGEIFSVSMHNMHYGGKLIISSTPNGNNFFTELMNGRITDIEPFYMLNPYLDPKNLEDMGRY